MEKKSAFFVGCARGALKIICVCVFVCGAIMCDA